MGEEQNTHGRRLVKASSRLKEDEDELVWTTNSLKGYCIAKMGYSMAFSLNQVRREDGGERGCMENQNPTKTKAFMWLVLSNRVLTWGE